MVALLCTAMHVSDSPVRTRSSTLNRLVPTEVHYIKKNAGIFSPEERMTWTSWMAWG